METFVVRITPRRIERLVILLIIAFLIFTTAYYANKYYDTTTEDIGYLDKIFSGTFFAKVPTQAEVAMVMENESEEVEEFELVKNVIVKEPPVETVNETVEEEEVPVVPAKCTENDFKVTSFDTEKIDDDTKKEGIIEKISVQYCNIDDDDNYMMTEIFIWDQSDEDLDLVDTRKHKPYYTTLQTMFMEPGEKVIKTYTFPSSRSVWRDEKFNYIVKFYFVDQAGEKIEAKAVKSLSSTYTIK